VIAVGDHLLGQAPEMLIRASCPFGGGLSGSREELCGVLSGGTLVLGALRGRLLPSENDEALRVLVRKFRERLIARYGSSLCNPIRDTMPDVDKRCAPVVEEGTRILLELLEEEKRA
jgi:C_GCAxxG_C_C family probable redox protein